MTGKAFLLLIVQSYTFSVGAMNLDPNLLSEKVKEFIDKTVKREELQTYVWNNLSFVDQTFDPELELNNMVKEFGDRFLARIRAVRKLRDAVVKGFNRKQPLAETCCSDFQTEENWYFRQQVATDRVCESISPNAVENATRLSDAFRDACIHNLQEVPSLKWQYFGSEEGITTNFPAARLCEDYDNRYRPWYIQAINPAPKQVIIIIDRSASMEQMHNGEPLMDLAKRTASMIIESLNPYDTVAVLAFANRAETWRKLSGGKGCFSEELAEATPQTKKTFYEYIENLKPVGGSYYQIPFDKAFDYLEDALQKRMEHYNTSRDFPNSTIHFISDGDPNDPLYKTIATLNRRMQAFGRTTFLITYGVGAGNFSVLETLGSLNLGSLQGGGFYNVLDLNNIRRKLGDFYRTSARATDQSNNDDLIWTVPYVDAFGLGQIITGTLPVFISNKLIGVAAIDVTLDGMLAESNHFRPNEYSYAFVIDNLGHLVSHPLYPYLDSEDALYVSATAVERDEKFHDVFHSMRAGESGNLTFLSTTVVSHGDSKRRGVILHKVMSTYYWKPIPNTVYSVCLVVAVNSTRPFLTNDKSLPDESYVHHRLDLVPPKTPCIHLNSLSSKDQSSVFFSWNAFFDSMYRLFHTVTASDVQDISRFMEGKGPNLNHLKRGIKDVVVTTYKAEELWKERSEGEHQEQVLWRYIGTPHGVLRMFPGTQLPDNYDHSETSWYQLAIAFRGKNIITPPYIDAASGSQVVSLSSVLFERRPDDEYKGNVRRDRVFAVVGVDILLSYFYSIFMEMYPVCQEQDKFKCIMIDKSGYIILIDEYATADASTHRVKHLAEVEPQVTSILIRDGILERINCSNIENGQLQRSYRVKDDLSIFRGTYGAGYYHFLGFKIIPVPKTNAYFIIRTLTTSECVNAFSCHCDTKEFFSSGQNSPEPLETSKIEVTAKSTFFGAPVETVVVSGRIRRRFRRNVTATSTNANATTVASIVTTGAAEEEHDDFQIDEHHIEDLSRSRATPSEKPQDTVCVASWKDFYCECPCSTVNPLFSPCLNEYELFSIQSPPCTPEARPIQPLQHPEDLSYLPKCYNVTFEAFLNYKEEFPTVLVAGLCSAGGAILILIIIVYNHPKVQNELRRRHYEKKQKKKAMKMASLTIAMSEKKKKRHSKSSSTESDKADSAHFHLKQKIKLSF